MFKVKSTRFECGFGSEENSWAKQHSFGLSQSLEKVSLMFRLENIPFKNIYYIVMALSMWISLQICIEIIRKIQ